ncbi:hypothetical protein MF271_00915 (plasmid) [Deinococcus sp. KNUC1210]|uniref:hypothetical protein n=1 Tax=Deinococcus sp. KNUC1210 TaxID=2917691 RepID=UPI001EF08802|nr:hypothetical protein [Deinococcus sp. KNUC1210]ULH13923.1 hypothetical protein MF271_00915 [Deinococcus sp. KNUC1210]
MSVRACLLGGESSRTWLQVPHGGDRMSITGEDLLGTSTPSAVRAPATHAASKTNDPAELLSVAQAVLGQLKAVEQAQGAQRLTEAATLLTDTPSADGGGRYSHCGGHRLDARALVQQGLPIFDALVNPAHASAGAASSAAAFGLTVAYRLMSRSSDSRARLALNSIGLLGHSAQKYVAGTSQPTTEGWASRVLLPTLAGMVSGAVGDALDRYLIGAQKQAAIDLLWLANRLLVNQVQAVQK